MKPTAFLALIFCCLAFSSNGSPAGAEETSADDLFDLLDEVREKKTERSIWGQMADNAQFKLTGRTMGYYRGGEGRPGVDDRAFGVDGRFEFKTDFRRGRHQFSTSGWLEAGSQEDTYSQKGYYFGFGSARFSVERMRRFFELNEFYWISSWGRLDWTLGKRLFSLGMMPLYSPSDRISPMDLNDPLDLKKYGLWQSTVDFYKGATRYSVTLVPFFISPKIPSPRSRWVSSVAEGGILVPADFQFFDVEVDPMSRIDLDLPDGADEIQVLSQIKTTFEGWDLILMGATGAAPYPVLRTGDPTRGETPLVREYIRAITAGLGFSTTAGKFEFHGEGIVQWSHQDKDDDFIAAAGGVTYTEDDRVQNLGLEKIRLTVDYAGEVVADQQNRRGFIQSSEIVRVGQNDFFVLASIQFHADFLMLCVANFNLDDYGSMVSPGVRFRPGKGLWLDVGFEFFQGPDDSFFGRWDKIDRLVFSLEYSF